MSNEPNTIATPHIDQLAPILLRRNDRQNENLVLHRRQTRLF